MLLTDFRPCPTVNTKVTTVKQPRFPVIDAHNHTGEDFGGGWCNRPVEEFFDALDQAGVRAFVDLDGGWGEEILHLRLDKFKAAAPERYYVFGGVDWTAWPEHGNTFGEWAAQRFRKQVARGAQGLKIWKSFGLQVRDQNDNLVPVDDPRLDPLWATAGELNLPIMVHVADPVAFFDPVDEINERWEELHAHPDWQFPSPPYPAFMTIMNQFANLVSHHPGTNFIGAHVGCYAENLDWVSHLLDRCPNFYVDISGRMGELGRQPYSTRRFFLKHADRILFGTDWPASVEWYRHHYRFLETDDEYFNYDREEIPRQGRWRVHGIFLPDDVLEKVYFKNAARLLPNVVLD
jgi:predicted TIM-barrel fold metal-dependent hydrolase